MVDPKLLERVCPLDNGRHEGWKKPGQPRDPGYLEKLAQELLHAVLLNLYLQSRTTLRSVNQRARSIVDALWRFKRGGGGEGAGYDEE
jgi:hypothetical protein